MKKNNNKFNNIEFAIFRLFFLIFFFTEINTIVFSQAQQNTKNHKKSRISKLFMTIFFTTRERNMENQKIVKQLFMAERVESANEYS